MMQKVRRLVFEIRMAIFVWIFCIAINFVPKQARATLHWILKMPIEDWDNSMGDKKRYK